MSTAINQSFINGHETLIPNYGISTEEPFLLPSLDLDIDDNTNEINQDGVKTWKDKKITKIKHTWVPDEQKIAVIDFFISKLAFIPFITFKTHLLDTAQRCSDTIKNSVVLIEPNKSQAWTAHMVTANLDIQPKAFLRLGEQYADKFASSLDSLPESFNQEDLKSIVIIDDASYSGTQIKNNVQAAHNLLKERGVDDAIFHIIIPYITNATLDVFNYLREQNINCNLYHAELMPTVEEILTNKDTNPDLDMDDEETEKAVLKVICPDKQKISQAKAEIKKITLTRFAHKTPNHMSLAPVFVNENVIQKVNPPYKIPATDQIEG